MENQLKPLNIPYERFGAIRPPVESLVEETGEYHSYFLRSTKWVKNMHKQERTHPRLVGVVGVYLSNYFIHKRAVNEGWGNYLILEDDCDLNGVGIDLVNKHLTEETIPSNWDMVRSLCGSPHSTVEKFITNNKSSKFPTSPDGAPDRRNNRAGGAHFTLCKGSSSRKIVTFLEEDLVYNIDGVYASKELNIYHTKCGVANRSPFGTDIPKIN
tara:strand:- start:1405 stop:2043 length:639 start_codon:yes stop_codon:yes gene_type:complete